ncbi:MULTISPECIES: lysozyme inhibitor LprI family protein [unclassified Yoonia]|uniref:lysozyme inhibitor LprI family protein n=1 Tax=unclassified Yoonia TaxID=2629118 RepID=UPI002AFEB1A3|nr:MULTISPECIES: lysozyme inhibitor LprI family protein [unclassified Yoonia]
MKNVALVLALLPCAAAAQTNWLYAPMVEACFDSGETSCTGTAATMCMADEPGGDTTMGMTSCLMAEHEVWDQLLNTQYALVLDYAAEMDVNAQFEAPEYAVRADQVRAAQRAWIAFRDANCTMQYGLWGSGSARHVAKAECLMLMTATQTRALHDYYIMP